MPPDVVYELEVPQVQRQLLLRRPRWDRNQLRKQRPEPLRGIDLDFAEPVPRRELPGRMADYAAGVAPFGAFGDP
jgi:hypothetical protein